MAHSAFLAWPEDDQDKALAWLAEQSQKCKRCGTREDEWDPKQGGDRHAYVAEVSRCRGCEVLSQEERDLQREMPDELGIRIGLTRNDEPDDEHDDDEEQ